MTERTSHLAGLWIGADISNTSHSNKASFYLYRPSRLVSIACKCLMSERFNTYIPGVRDTAMGNCDYIYLPSCFYWKTFGNILLNFSFISVSCCDFDMLSMRVSKLNIIYLDRQRSHSKGTFATSGICSICFGFASFQIQKNIVFVTKLVGLRKPKFCACG
jgi:hypothetical protein